MSLATQAVATATSEYWVSVTDVVVDAVCFVRNTAVEVVVTSSAKQFQPVVAAGKPITPDVAVPPVPTLMRNAAVPLLAVTEGEVPKPDDMVGAALLTSRLVSVIVVNLPVLAVVAPIDTLSIVPAVAGLIVTTPVPVGERTTLAFAGLRVTVLDAPRVVNDPVEPLIGVLVILPPVIAALLEAKLLDVTTPDETPPIVMVPVPLALMVKFSFAPEDKTERASPLPAALDFMFNPVAAEAAVASTVK